MLRLRCFPLLAIVVAACRASGAGPDPGSDARAPAIPAIAAVEDPCELPSPPGDFVLRVDVGAVPRRVRVHVPAPEERGRRAPLVMAFHGMDADAFQQMSLSGMNEAAGARGFLVAHPEGIGRSWNGGSCCGKSRAEGVDDIAFTRAAIEALEQRYCVDGRRVFVAGMSNGAFLAQRIACGMADRVAAVAAVAGSLGVACAPVRPISVLSFHGTADELVPYAGGGEAGAPAAPDLAAVWSRRDGCEGPPVTTLAHGDARCEAWRSCRGGAEVALCTIEGGGHTWPGGHPVRSLGRTSRDLDATVVMLDFFEGHPLPPPP